MTGNSNRAGRRHRKEEQLPLASLRKHVFKKVISEELAEDLNVSPKHSSHWIFATMQEHHEEIVARTKKEFPLEGSLDDYLCKEAPSNSSVYRWFKKDSYPGATWRKHFKYTFPMSYQWLVPGKSHSPFIRVFDALDYCLIRQSEQKSRALFNLEYQDKYLISELRRIYSRWVIPNDAPSSSLDEAILLGLQKKSLMDDFHSSIVPESVSYSLLMTHGVSALPFHLLSISDYHKVPEDCIFEWLCDLFVSALLVSAMYEDNISKVGEMYDSQCNGDGLTSRMKFDPFGTSPSIVKIICSFSQMLGFLLGRFKWYFEDGLTQGLHNIDNVQQNLNTGVQTFIDQIKYWGIDWSSLVDITMLQAFGAENGKAHLQVTLEQVWREIDTVKPINIKPEPINQNHQAIRYLLTNRYGIPVLLRDSPKVIILLAAAKSTFPAVDGQYSWGYYGNGPRNLATTILEDYCGHNNFSNEHIRVFIYRILSVFQSDFEYAIAGTQIEDVLSLKFIHSES